MQSLNHTEKFSYKWVLLSSIPSISFPWDKFQFGFIPYNLGIYIANSYFYFIQYLVFRSLEDSNSYDSIFLGILEWKLHNLGHMGGRMITFNLTHLFSVNACTRKNVWISDIFDCQQFKYKNWKSFLSCFYFLFYQLIKKLA